MYVNMYVYNVFVHACMYVVFRVPSIMMCHALW